MQELEISCTCDRWEGDGVEEEAGEEGEEEEGSWEFQQLISWLGCFLGMEEKRV